MSYKNSKSLHHTNFISRKKVALLAIALLALYVVVPHLSSFQHSLITLRDAYLPYVWVAFLFWLATFLFAALVYKLISPKALPYRPTLLIELAGGFTNRLAPAGAGRLVLGSRYLMKRGNSGTTAGALVATNNLLGIFGNMLLIVAAIVLSAGALSNLLDINFRVNYPELFIGLVLVAAVLAILLTRRKFTIKLKDTVRVMMSTTFHRPMRLFGAFLASLAVTVCYGVMLTFIELAFNVHVSVAQTLFVLAFGVISATITPTPGGIGGAEAGMVAAFVAVGVPAQQGLAIALTYRFIMYWLPILPGFVAFQVALRRRYI